MVKERLPASRRLRSQFLLMQVLPSLIWPCPFFQAFSCQLPSPQALHSSHTFRQTSCHLHKTLCCFSPMFTDSPPCPPGKFPRFKLTQSVKPFHVYPGRVDHSLPWSHLVLFLSLCNGSYHPGGYLCDKGGGCPKAHGIPTAYLTQK